MYLLPDVLEVKQYTFPDLMFNNNKYMEQWLQAIA